jgi:hypothetical protein
MLIGDGFYYNAKTGKRTNDFDRDVTASAVAETTRIYDDLIGQWICRNGDPSDVRYFKEGKQITVTEEAS